MQFAVDWAHFPAQALSFGFGHAETRGTLPSAPLPPVPAHGWSRDRGCPSCLSPSVAPRCLPLCSQSRIHADWNQFPSQKSNVSVITSMQVPSCWINVASCNSPAVSQAPEHPFRLVPGLQLACGQPEGLSVGCVVAIPPHRCTLTPLRALLDL